MIEYVIETKGLTKEYNEKRSVSDLNLHNKRKKRSWRRNRIWNHLWNIRFMQGWCNVYVRFKYYNLIKEREAIIYDWICNRNKRVN